MSIAAIYTRVSTSAQEESGTSLDTQMAACEAYCAERDYQIIGRYSDTHSGAQYRERPALSALRDAVRAGGVDVVVAYSVDRLSRQQAHLYILAEELEEHGARLEFVTEDFEDSAVGRFIRSARAFAAEVEREKFAERSIRGRRAAIAAGKPHRGPYPLYGYQWTDDHARLVADPLTAPVVQRIYRDYLSGMTLRAIAQALYDDGIPSPQGARQWHPNAVGRLLRHRHYSGDAYGWVDRRGSGIQRDLPDDAIPLPDGTVEPLVTPEEWQAVQDQMLRNRQRASRNTYDPESALLRGGFVRCGVCGAAMSLDRDARGQYRYRCSSGHRLRAERCNVSIATPLLDSAVWERVEAVLLHPETVMAELEARAGSQSAGAEAGRLDRQIRTLTTRQERLARAISMLDDPDDIAPLAAQVADIGKARRALEAERDALSGAQRETADLRANLAAFTDWRERIRANLPELTYGQQRGILDALGISVDVYRRGDTPRFTIHARVDIEAFVKPSSSAGYHNSHIALRWDVPAVAD